MSKPSPKIPSTYDYKELNAISPGSDKTHFYAVVLDA
jgi:hypothetical protein